MTKTATIADFGSHLADYLADVQRGDEVLVMRESVAVARLVPIPEEKIKKQNRTKLGCGIGTVKILGPLDEPLIPESDWEMLRGDE